MVCGCSKKQGANAAAMIAAEHIGDPAEWGPFLWKYLHVLAEQIGRSGNTIVDTDQAQYMEAMVSTLPQVIPCMECQAHAATYLAANPVPPLKGLYGADLRARIRAWLFEFHQAVRIQKGQPILIENAESCEALYANQQIPKCEYNGFVQSVAAAVRQGWVKLPQWRKWYSYSERIRILSGNVIV